MNTDKKPENPFVKAAEEEKEEKKSRNEEAKPQAKENGPNYETSDRANNTPSSDPSRNDGKGERPEIPAY